MIDQLFSGVVEKLKNEDIFSGYKYRKRDYRLIKKEAYGFTAIELQFWDGFDLQRNKRALVIKPLYLKRFDILHKWFEQFSFKSLLDQRDNYSIGFDGKMLGKQNEFFFLLSLEDFDRDYSIFKSAIFSNVQYLNKKFSSTLDLYHYLLDPILIGKNAELPNNGADWVFEYLTLAKIEKPDTYLKIKTLIMDQVEALNKRGEPNIIEYYPKMNLILKVLESDNL